jgi:2-dehydropantoate 2-reductase
VRFLFLGAGAIGGYFGGRLLEKGVDVTFLVRPARRDELARTGLKIESPLGDFSGKPQTVKADDLRDPFDVVVLTAKAYDLAGAIDAITPAVRDSTVVLPLLNGMRHLDDLDRAFGKARVLGGTCHISATLAPGGTVRHLSPLNALTQGARDPAQEAVSARMHETFANAFDAKHADDIIAAMWDKWYFLAVLAASTTLMRAPIPDFAADENGRTFAKAMLAESVAIATRNGYQPPDPSLAFAREHLTDPGSKLSSSMLRDVERGGDIEADHIIGDLIRRGRQHGVETPLLDLALVNLKTYLKRRADKT